MEDDIESQGGILTVVAANIVGFDVQFFDGNEWQMEWPPEENLLPELVEVSLAGQTGGDEEKPQIMVRDFVVSFPRLGQQTQGGSDATAESE